jgi:hypothetical protein
MQLLEIQNVQYHPAGEVAVMVHDEMGGTRYINTNQSALPANWGDADVLAAAQAALDDPAGQYGTGRPPGVPLLAGKGHVLVWPTV